MVQYVNTDYNGDECPECGLDDLEKSQTPDPSLLTGEIYIDVTCLDCGYEFIEVYKLRGYIKLQRS